MARCVRCKKFMLFAPKEGYCQECELQCALEKLKDEQRLRIELENKLRLEVERHHLAENKRKLAEENLKTAEETQRKQELLLLEAEKARKIKENLDRAAEQAKREEEERKKKAEEEKRYAEEVQRKEIERHRRAEEIRKELIAREKQKQEQERLRLETEKLVKAQEDARRAKEQEQRKDAERNTIIKEEKCHEEDAQRMEEERSCNNDDIQKKQVTQKQGKKKAEIRQPRKIKEKNKTENKQKEATAEKKQLKEEQKNKKVFETEKEEKQPEEKQDEEQKLQEYIIATKKAAIQERKIHLIEEKKEERFGQYGVGDTIEFGQYQFSDDSEEKEPIEWIVLDVFRGKALLIAKNILDYQSFASEFGSTETWENSFLRKWLNHEFVDAAFNEEQKEILYAFPYDDSERCCFSNAYLKRVIGIDTTQFMEDKVFLLSITEACDTDIFNPKLLEVLRDSSITMYAESKNEYKNELPIIGWWLRSSGDYTTHAVYAFCSAQTPYNIELGEYSEEYFGAGIKHINMGVRPVVWIDIYRYINTLISNDSSGFDNDDIPVIPQQNTHQAVETKRSVIKSFHTKIVGVTHNNEGENTENRQRIIRDLSRKGLLEPGQELELRPEPHNRFDHQAVAVIGPDGRQLGFLSKELAHQLFDKLQSTGGYSAFVSAVTGGDADFSYGVNVKIEEYDTTAKPQFKSYSKENAVDDFHEGMELLCQEDFDGAIKLFQRSAEYGYHHAQYQLGCCYDYGKGTKIDAEKANYWYLKAAEQGNANAQADLAYNYYDGIGVSVDYKKALYWNNKAVAQKHANAMVILGTMYERGLGVKQNYEKSFELYRQAAELGNVDGMHNTGTAYLIGRGVERDPCEAAKWNKNAANNNHSLAQYNLAIQYLIGDGIPKNTREAHYWMIQAANNGNLQAKALLQQNGGMLG